MATYGPHGMLGLVILLAGLAGPAFAGDPGVQAAKAEMIDPARPRSIAPQPDGSPEVAAIQIRDEVDRLIAAAGGEALFENISTTRIGVARHSASGMTCLFTPSDPMNLIVVYPLVPGGPLAGDDVSCRTGLEGGVFATVYATRYRQQPTDQELLDHAMADLNGVWTEVQPLPSGYSFQHSRNHPDPMTAAFTGNLQGHRLRSFTLVQNIGDWSFKGRASGPVNDEDVSMVGSGYYSIALPGNWDARQNP